MLNIKLSVKLCRNIKKLALSILLACANRSPVHTCECQRAYSGVKARDLSKTREIPFPQKLIIWQIGGQSHFL